LPKIRLINIKTRDTKPINKTICCSTYNSHRKGILVNMPPSTCGHEKLTYQPSPNATTAGYTQPTLAQRFAATTPQGIYKAPAIDKEDHASIFPGPLVLPEDELSWDPSDPPQSFRSWLRSKTTNKVTPERKTVYLMGPPNIDPSLKFAHKWAHIGPEREVTDKPVAFPNTEEILEYLQAFYHGLPVKLLQARNFGFTADVDEGSPPTLKGRKKARKPEQSPTLWFNTDSPSGCIGVRTRATPKGPFTHQLNLNDLLDAAIEILPSDAYALLMIVEHDIYEDDDDDFCCGRAYGASRIAVVSGARYNPALDDEQGLERDHAWPASHCENYVQSCCGVDGEKRKKKKLKIDKNSPPNDDGENSPMRAALNAHVALPPLNDSRSMTTLSGLWLGRICRTAGHELGHCFGIDHCVYYACSMQGTGSVIEDARQPPYLCPVDLAKVLRATGADEKERYGTLLAFCEKHKAAHLFAAFSSWIRRRHEIEAQPNEHDHPYLPESLACRKK
jgi:archaemetzincin